MSAILKPVPRAELAYQVAMRAVRDRVDVSKEVSAASVEALSRQIHVGTSELHRCVAIKRYAPDLMLRVIRDDMSMNQAYEAALKRRKEMGGPVARTFRARDERDAVIRRMSEEGYREKDIADAIGMSVESVRSVMHRRLGIQTLSEKLGNQRRLDPNRIMEGLVTAAEPATDALIAVDWNGLDPTRIEAWQKRLTGAIHDLTVIRNKLRRTPRASE